jgi:anaerobic dimethyl sulfoxide reductase subunit B
MTKCDFCVERLDNGLQPICVAACPLRSLDFGERSDLVARYGISPAIFPLPEAGQTEPALFITPHPDATHASASTAQVMNRQEIHLDAEQIAEIARIVREGKLP